MAKREDNRQSAWAEGRAVVTNCRKEPYDVYVGRKHPTKKGEDGYFGNPISNAKDMDPYIAYFLDRMLSDKEFRQRVDDLKGKRLGCWCYPKACHAMVLACWANLEPIDKNRLLKWRRDSDEGEANSIHELSDWAIADWGE